MQGQHVDEQMKRTSMQESWGDKSPYFTLIYHSIGFDTIQGNLWNDYLQNENNNVGYNQSIGEKTSGAARLFW